MIHILISRYPLVSHTLLYVRVACARLSQRGIYLWRPWAFGRPIDRPPNATLKLNDASGKAVPSASLTVDGYWLVRCGNDSLCGDRQG